MKRLIALSLAVITVLFCLSACGKNDKRSCKEIITEYTWSAFMVTENDIPVIQSFDDGTGVINFFRFDENGCMYKYMDKESKGQYAGTYSVNEKENAVDVVMGQGETSYSFRMLLDRDYSFDGSKKTIPVLKIIDGPSVEYYADYDLFTETFGEIS